MSDLINLDNSEEDENDYHWYCKYCNKTVSDMSKVLGSLDKRLTTLANEVTEVKSDLNEVKSEVKNKCDEIRVKEIVAEEIKEKLEQKNGEATIVAETTATVKEVEDRQSRKTKFLIFNAEEVESNLKEQTNKNNLKIVNDIVKMCGIELEEEIKTDHVLRLGIKSDRPRPILVEIQNMETKRELFKVFENKKKNPENEHFKNLKIAHDLTKMQQLEEKKMISEAKDLEEKNAGKKFRVRGPSWDRKIVEMKR